MSRRVLLALAFIGCQIDLDVPQDTHVSCDTDAHCFNGQLCHPVRKECVKPGISEAVLPRPAVSFVSPSNDEQAVPVAPSIIVAFDMGVTADSVRAAVSLVPEQDTRAVPIGMTETEEANIFRFDPDDTLDPLTWYTLSVGVGVLPLSTDALPGERVFTSRFETGSAPDETPPAVVTDLLVDHRSETGVHLSWVNPVDDFAGVLILRKRGTPVAESPVDKTAYATGTMIGVTDPSEVVAVTRNPFFLDVDVTADAYDYTLFAFDTVNNYADGVRAPFPADVTAWWCPDETGGMLVATPDTTAVQQVELSVIGAAAGDGTVLPAATEPVLSETTFAPAPPQVVVGQTYAVRARLTLGANTYVALGREVPFLSAQLTQTNAIFAAVLDEPVRFEFDPGGWSGFDGEADTHIDSGVDVFSATGVTVGADYVEAVFTSPGEYLLRARPRDSNPSCAVAEWSYSNRFQPGIAAYVIEGGLGTGTGVDPANAAATIVDGLSLAIPGSTVRVAAGSYPEAVFLPAGVWLQGGYSVDFSLNDPAVYESVIEPTAPYVSANGKATAVAISGVDVGPETILEGFTIAPAFTDNFTSAIEVYDSANPTIRLNTIRNAVSGTLEGMGVHSHSGGNPVLVDNFIDRPDGTQEGIGVEIAADGAAEIRDNRIEARVGVRLNGFTATATIEGNEITPDPASVSNKSGAGVLCRRGDTVVVRDNLIVAGYGAQPEAMTIRADCNTIIITGNILAATNGGSCFTIHIDDPNPVARISNNIIYGAASGFQSTVYCNTCDDVAITNNLLVGIGTPTTSMVYVIDGTPSITNNVFFSETSAYAVMRSSGTGYPSSFRGNLAIGAPAHWRFDNGGNETFTSLGGMEASFCASGHLIPTSNNAIVTLPIAELFVDHDGPDDDLSTLDDNDWHLLTTHTAISEAGLDTSGDTCGGVGSGCPGTGTESCGNVTADLDDVARTVPYSTGPYEAD